ncbi:MAG: lactonase family protein [Bdellovibrionota bacterium]
MRAKQFLAAVFGLLILSSCSLEHAPNTMTVNLDLTKMNLRKTRHAVLPDHSYTGRFNELSEAIMNPGNVMSVAAPSSIAGFTCFGVNVTAFDIPASNGNFEEDPNNPDCTYPGVTSALAKASGNGASIELPVPSGPQRTFQVLGLQTTSGCPSGFLGDHVYDSTVVGAYELGRTKSDIYLDSTLSIKSRFTPDNLKKPFTCPSFGFYAYVIDDNGGGAGVHGTVTGYKINMQTGALTQIPAATKTTTGIDSQWIITSNAGKWVFVVNGNFSTTNQGDVDVFSVNAATGALTFVGNYPVGASGTGDNNLAIDPYDEYLFVGGDSNIAAFQINQTTGALGTPVQFASVATGTSGIAVGPSGTSLYAVDGNIPGATYQFTINATGNPLSPLSPASVAIDSVSTQPIGLAMDPEGDLIYTANAGDAGAAGTGMGLSQYYVNSNNTLSKLPGPADVGTQYPSVVVDPYWGVNVYAADTLGGDDGVVAFPIQVDGTLGDYFDFTPSPNPTLINNINMVTIDNWSSFVFATYNSGHLVSFEVDGDGYFTGNNHYATLTGTAPTVTAVAIAKIQQ